MSSRMEQMVAQVKRLVPLKNETLPGDVVLILAGDQEMAAYAVVTGIEPDTTRRDAWWHVHLFLLTMPPQTLTWTLRSEQMSGGEIFTMGGAERFVKALALPASGQPTPLESGAGSRGRPVPLRVIK